MKLVITQTNSITALGHDGQTCAASYSAGITRIEYDSSFGDSHGNPIKSSRIEDLFTDQKNEAQFMEQVAVKCLTDLCTSYFETRKTADQLFLLVGLPCKDRPGPDWTTLTDTLTEAAKPFAAKVTPEVFQTGNAAAVNAMMLCREILSENPYALFMVGGVDSLLDPETLAWFEQDQRLKSDSLDRENSMVPSHAAGFFILESEQGARLRKSPILAKIRSMAQTMEPAPYVSDKPSRNQGLSRAIHSAFTQSGLTPSAVDSVWCDLNGEYHRAREWGLADLRCFEHGNPEKQLYHPADCMGSVGAASIPLLVNLGVEHLKKKDKTLCLFASDDFGERGALIIQKHDDA